MEPGRHGILVEKEEFERKEKTGVGIGNRGKLDDG